MKDIQLILSNYSSRPKYNNLTKNWLRSNNTNSLGPVE